MLRNRKVSIHPFILERKKKDKAVIRDDLVLHSSGTCCGAPCPSTLSPCFASFS